MARSMFGEMPPDDDVNKGEAAPKPRRKPIIKGGATSAKYIAAATQGGADRTYQEIVLDHIQDSAIQDRIDLSHGIDELMESLEKDGQKVPIIVRIVNQDKPYEIVAGRRRMEAARRLGHKTIRGFIHKMSDEEAFRIQGIENNQRVETSFIERARTAHQAAKAGITQQSIADFLSISQTLVNFMRRIFEDVGEELAVTIGPASGIGRRKWEALLEVAKGKNLTSQDLVGMVDQEIPNSNDRFEDLMLRIQSGKAVSPTQKQPKAATIKKQYKLSVGKYAAELKPRAFVIKPDRNATPEFLDYLDSRIPDLMEEFEKDREED